MWDELLEAIGVKNYEDLTPEERRTFETWLDEISQKEITLDDVRNYVSQMRSSVELKVVSPRLSEKNRSFLLARLKNYVLLENFLLTPIKAKQALGMYVGQLKKKQQSKL